MAKCHGHSHSQVQLNHHANQMNPNNAAYAAAKVNHGNQLNPCHAEYAGSRGESHSADSKPASNDD